MARQSRGHLIVVEGLDRSGKTTQCQMLCEIIERNNKQCKYVKYPNRTTATGQMINSYLQGSAELNDEAIHLLFSANRWEAAQSLLEDLQNGCTIVVDRYSFSGAVYSTAKDNAHLSLDWCWAMEVGLPRPDIVLFLDISSEDAAKRGGYGEERYEKEDMQLKVRTLFKQLFSRLPRLDLVTINAGLSIEQVAAQMRKAVEGLDSTGVLKEVETLPPLSASNA